MSQYAVFEDEKSNDFTCPICYSSSIPPSDIRPLPCLHSFCEPCLVLHFQHLIDSSQIKRINCPSCETPISRDFLSSILTPTYLSKYDRYLLRENLQNNPYARFCPQADCEGFDMGNLSKKKLTCNICRHEFCFFCSEPWHGKTKCEKKSDEDFESWAAGHHVKFCPSCKRRVEKRGGCPNMSCICGNTWCWRCGGKASDPGHDIKCFFGSDLWNVKRTIILMLIFAPIVIYFIPLVFVVFIMDMMNEGDDSMWFIRHRVYLYPFLALFSPVIEVLAIVAYVFFIALSAGINVSKKSKLLSLPVFIIVLVGASFVAVFAVILAIALTFFASIAGFGLLLLKFVGKINGKELKDVEFYPHSIP